MTWLHFPSLRNFNITSENIHFSGGAIEQNFVQAVACAIRKDSAWPNIRQISITHPENHWQPFQIRAAVNHGIEQHLQKNIVEYCKGSKLDFVRQYEVVGPRPED